MKYRLKRELETNNQNNVRMNTTTNASLHNNFWTGSYQLRERGKENPKIPDMF
jgi:hypothetical protein